MVLEGVRGSNPRIGLKIPAQKQLVLPKKATPTLHYTLRSL
jgi:hypothetical protein